MDRDRDERDPLPEGEVGRALVERPEVATRTAGSGPPPRSRPRRRRRSTAWTRRVASIRSFLPGRYGIVAPVQVISRFRPPTDMSSSFGPKNISRGRIGRVAMSRNGSTQLRWLKQ